MSLTAFMAGSVTHAARRADGAPSALVEDGSAGRRGVLLDVDLDGLRREQEHLGRDSLDGPAQPEDEAHRMAGRQVGHLGAAVLGSVVGIAVVVVVLVVLVVVATLVLGEAKVDHRLAQRASHEVLLGRRPRLIGAVRRDRSYRCDAREPRIADPTRRCVAPSAMAASRSPLIPAEIHVASGWSRRMPSPTSRRRANAARGSPSRGATAMTPRSLRAGAPATRSASARAFSGATPPRPSSGSSDTWTVTSSRRPAAPAARSRAPTSLGRSTDWTTSA